MNTTLKVIVLVTVLTLGSRAVAQEKGYKEGSVWSINLIKSTYGMGEDYLKSLKNTWVAVQEEAKKQGLILSYKVLAGAAANPDDWDIMLLVEFKNLAAMEGMDEKWEAIHKKFVGDEASTKKLMDSRVSVRTVFGDKLMRELIYK